MRRIFFIFAVFGQVSIYINGGTPEILHGKNDFFHRLPQKVAFTSISRQFFAKEVSGIGRGAGCDLLRGAADDEAAACFAALGAEVDDVVGTFDDFHIVFDDEDGMASVNEGVETFEQLFDVVEVEAGSRFVEDEEGGG